MAQTGVQILFAFLLSLAVSGRFSEIGAFERTAYLVALLSAAAATALIIASGTRTPPGPQPELNWSR